MRIEQPAFHLYTSQLDSCPSRSILLLHQIEQFILERKGQDLRIIHLNQFGGNGGGGGDGSD